MKKSTKTFLKISGAGVILATFASIVAYKTTKSLVAAAIDRNEPKLIQKAEKKSILLLPTPFTALILSLCLI